jgi:hypothetical protein
MPTTQHKFPLSSNEIGASANEWIVYVSWRAGKLDFVRRSEPQNLPSRENVWVMACMPVPTVTVRSGK